LDLGLICDVLQELSELSLDLQERNIDLHKAHSKIECLLMYVRREGLFQVLNCKKSLEAAKNLEFKGDPLHKKNRIDDPIISPVAFCEQFNTFNSEKTALKRRHRTIKVWKNSRFKQLASKLKG
jgi:hypothetical protein